MLAGSWVVNERNTTHSGSTQAPFGDNDRSYDSYSLRWVPCSASFALGLAPSADFELGHAIDFHLPGAKFVSARNFHCGLQPGVSFSPVSSARRIGIGIMFSLRIASLYCRLVILPESTSSWRRARNSSAPSI